MPTVGPLPQSMSCWTQWEWWTRWSGRGCCAPHISAGTGNGGPCGRNTGHTACSASYSSCAQTGNTTWDYKKALMEGRI